MITEEQVTTAEATAETAQEAQEAAEAALAAAPYSDVAAARLSSAAQFAAQRRANARELRETFGEQRAAQLAAADRGTREKAAAPLIAAAGTELEGARKAFVARTEEAQRAIAGLMDAAITYNAVVDAHATALAAAGLDLIAGSGAEVGGDHQVTGPKVRLRGREFEQVDPGIVAVWVTHKVGEARLPEYHPVAGPLRLFNGVLAIEARAEALFAGLAKPKRVEHPLIRWPRAAVLRAPGKRAS